MKAKYVNPFTDFGFKKIFGEEADKNSLIDLLNALLSGRGEGNIKDLSFKNSEQLPETADNRKAVFDIYCENDKGEKFIVELQKARQNFFKERTIYYSTFPIREQVEKGNWNFELKAIYCIGILDFVFNDYDKTDPEADLIVHYVDLKNQLGRTFYNKLTYIYLEMPRFNKTIDELNTRLDQWLYFIKNLEDIQTIPQIFAKDAVFVSAFQKAELAKMTVDEYNKYETSLKGYRDWYNIIDAAKQDSENKGRLEGKLEGRMEGLKEGAQHSKIEIARRCIARGMDIATIEELTGLPIQIISEMML